MQTNHKTLISVVLLSAMLAASGSGGTRAGNRPAPANSNSAVDNRPATSDLKPAFTDPRSAPDKAETFAPSHRAPVLGADLVWADGPHILVEAWQNKAMGDALYDALQMGGVRSLRMSFHGLYSHRGEAASAKIKAENKMTNEYPWFPFADFSNYIAAYDITTVVGINVEEGADVAADAVRTFTGNDRQAKLVAVELSNEPWLNHRPWQPEEYAARAADVIERLTPMGVKFALPLTVGDSRNTPTKLSDTEWNTRMMRALSSRIDLKNREDIYGVLHLYAGGVRAKSVEFFNRIVRPFAPKMRYLVTEFNIRLNLEGNPHLTNQYGLEFARKLAELMNVPDIEALYVHAIPYHSIMYWTNRKQKSTVIGGRDPKLKKEDLTQGWHLTPAGKVYALYSKLAWNGEVISYKEDGKQRYWAVKSPSGRVVVSLLNEKDQPVTKRLNIAGKNLQLRVPPQSLVCFDANGSELEKVLLPF
jgi:hypothetical protein